MKLSAHLIIAPFLLAFSGWTLSAHLCVLLGLGAYALIALFPCVTTLLLLAYRKGTRIPFPGQNARTPPQDTVSERLILQQDHSSSAEIWWMDAPHPDKLGARPHHGFFGRMLDTTHALIRWRDGLALHLMLAVSPLVLHASWYAFWAYAILLLLLCLVDKGMPLGRPTGTIPSMEVATGQFIAPALCLFILVFIILALSITRSDLDDAYYAAVAAHMAAHPEAPLQSGDPMLGETGFPLIFHSFRFSSFELLSGALGLLSSSAALDAYYIYLVPLWSGLAVLATYLLVRQLQPQQWLLPTICTLALVLLLGEMHRSSANFSFVRIFQGKAVFVSVLVPCIYYLTNRVFSASATRADFLLLACCQISAIGMSNIGMLMGPLAGFSALMANIAMPQKYHRIRFPLVASLLLIPLPYLLDVLIQSAGSPLLEIANEPPNSVWKSVFGHHQQYLVALLLLAGPVLSTTPAVRWRLTVPTLILMVVYLNPWLAGFISRHVTTPAVYWRVVWTLPVLIYMGVGGSMLLTAPVLWKRHHPRAAVAMLILMALVVQALPHHTLRPSNIEPYQGFATWKIRMEDLQVAQEAMALCLPRQRLLAPERIAGVISRFEHHPPLIATRDAYIDFMKPYVNTDQHLARRVLYDFANGRLPAPDNAVRNALNSLQVGMVVTIASQETPQITGLLSASGFRQASSLSGHHLWTKQP